MIPSPARGVLVFTAKGGPPQDAPSGACDFLYACFPRAFPPWAKQGAAPRLRRTAPVYVPANLPGKQAVPAGGRRRRWKLHAVRSRLPFLPIVPYRRTRDVVL